jgi:hypothetical protein
MIHPIKKPTSVDATKCPITRFREPVCHSCFTSVHVVRNLFPIGRFAKSGSEYEKVSLGLLSCTAAGALDEDMVRGLRCKQGSEDLAGFVRCRSWLTVVLGEDMMMKKKKTC